MEVMKTVLECIGCWIVAYYASGIVHEGGHVVAGLAQGWKFELLVVGPLKLYRGKDGKVRLGIEKNILLWCGIGGTAPAERSEANLKKFARTLLAGPAASILFGMLCGISLFWGVTVFRAMMTFIPIGMGIFCLNPKAKTGILYSDGGRFLRIVKGGKTAAEEKAIFEAAFLEKMDPNGSYDEQGILVMTSSDDVSFQFLGHYYAWLNAKKNHNEEEMKIRIHNMEQIKKDVPKAVVDMCVMED